MYCNNGKNVSFESQKKQQLANIDYKMFPVICALIYQSSVYMQQQGLRVIYDISICLQTQDENSWVINMVV